MLGIGRRGAGNHRMKLEEAIAVDGRPMRPPGTAGAAGPPGADVDELGVFSDCHPLLEEIDALVGINAPIINGGDDLHHARLYRDRQTWADWTEGASGHRFAAFCISHIDPVQVYLETSTSQKL